MSCRGRQAGDYQEYWGSSRSANGVWTNALDAKAHTRHHQHIYMNVSHDMEDCSHRP